MIFTLLKDKAVTGTFTVQPNDSETARTFIEAMSQTNKISTTYSHGFNRTKVEIVNDFFRLNQIVNDINQSSYDRKITVDMTKDFSLQKLFDLHEHFEDLGERKRSKDPTLSLDSYEEIINLGCEMNGLIHKLESDIKGGDFFQALFQKPDIVRIPLTESIIKEAVQNYRADHLYVGFGETGKNMGHIFQINDIEVLHRKLVQPQRFVLTEFFLPFSTHSFDYEKYIKWCKDNDAEGYGYDYTNPIWYGKWEIGKIISKSWRTTADFPLYNKVEYTS
jgi:hypothetical protein